jgi:hypothetical protein
MATANSMTADRRDQASRQQLLAAVRAEFDELPCHRLTAAQVRRLFDLRPDICDRVLATLVRDHTLWIGCDDRYTRCHDAAPHWPRRAA